MIDLLDPTTDDYLFVYNYQKDYFYIAPHAVQRFVIEENAFYNATQALEKLVYPTDFERLHEDLSEVISSGRIQNMTYRWMSKDGEPIWINSRGYVVRDDQNGASYLVGCINEIGETAQKADNLSGLLSLSSLQASLSQYESEFPDGYFLRLGLDDLKGINARLGVEYGNAVLRKTAEIISGALVPGQEIYRIVGDEFLVIDFMGNGANDAKALYARIQKVINSYIIESNY